MADYAPFGVPPAAPMPDAAPAQSPFPPEVMAMLLERARSLIQAAPAAPQMSDSDQAAMSPETYSNPMAKQMIGSLATLPQRAIDAAGQDFANRGTGAEPQSIGPALETAMLPMGTGAIAGVPMRAGEQVLGAGPIRAYHGSPHDFDQFSLDKIGTGEGAQAYGHGLYFAENEGVAKSYRDALIPKDSPTFLAIKLMDEKPPLRPEEKASWTEDNQRETALAKLENIKGQLSPENYAGTRDLLQSKKPLGRMYEVQINADPEHFLDWDKPLSEQGGVDRFSKLPDFARPLNTEEASNVTGQRLHQRLANKLGEDGAHTALREAGVPGIKYLDQGSRASGEGSRNYVVFNDKLIDILKKYGLAGLSAGGVGALATGHEDKT